MTTYIGIDLGTTNSAIATYDGEAVRLWKSPEQNDVTPSAIFYDKRGNRYVGRKAYDKAAHEPDRVAQFFKRMIGSDTKIPIEGLSEPLSPEQCSAEILRTLVSYLPEEHRSDPEVGVVITVPAAFNQMQKDATKAAAEMAGIGAVALMQEPVAAVMSIMRASETDGAFMVYDLGGGTLDVAVAEATAGHVSLISHGGVEMMGGRDIDRGLAGTLVIPWLRDNFSLPEDLHKSDQYLGLLRLVEWASERAKIALSGSDSAVVSLDESEVRVKDEAGKEIYVELEIKQAELDGLIADITERSIEAARDTLKKSGLSEADLTRIAFVGGPTNYAPLRNKVVSALGVSGGTDVNPMTAVAEGAAIFAEAVDWSTTNRSRKSNRGQVASSGSSGLSVNFIARTPAGSAKLAFSFSGSAPDGAEVQVDAIDTGWSSGRVPLQEGSILEVSLTKPGDNRFKVFAFDGAGAPIPIEDGLVTISRTAASVDAIPASHTISLEVLNEMGGRPVLMNLVRAGDSLPVKGEVTVRAGTTVKAGEAEALVFKLWEGEIEEPIEHNKQVGAMKISGRDFSGGVIAAGDKLVLKYEFQDSGAIDVEVSSESVQASFTPGRNFYSRQESGRDYSQLASDVREEGRQTIEHVDRVSSAVEDDRVSQAQKRLESALSLDEDESRPEESKRALDDVQEARRLLAAVRKDHRKAIRQVELDEVIQWFNEGIREFARPSEQQNFENLAKTAQRSIDEDQEGFEDKLDQMRRNNYEILWRQDWFVAEMFRQLARAPGQSTDPGKHAALTEAGMKALERDDIGELRNVVAQLQMIRRSSAPPVDMAEMTNIVRE